MGSKILGAPIYADAVLGAGRKSKAWFRIGVEHTRQGKMVTEKLFEDESKGYIVFKHCDTRQKRALVSAVDNVKTEKGQALVYTCCKCHLRIPVLPPFSLDLEVVKR